MAGVTLWAARRFPRLRPLLARVLSDERKREIFEVVFNGSRSMRFAVWLLASTERAAGGKRTHASALECTFRAWWLGVIE